MMQAAANPPHVAPTLSVYVNLAGVAFFLLFIGYSIIMALKNKREDDVAIHVGRALAAAQLPSAAILIYAGFDPSVLSQLSGLNIGLVVAGVVLGWVSIKTMIIAPARTEKAVSALKTESTSGAISGEVGLERPPQK